MTYLTKKYDRKKENPTNESKIQEIAEQKTPVILFSFLCTITIYHKNLYVLLTGCYH